MPIALQGVAPRALLALPFEAQLEAIWPPGPVHSAPGVGLAVLMVSELPLGSFYLPSVEMANNTMGNLFIWCSLLKKLPLFLQYEYENFPNL